jgi:2-hydroxy-3-oxopropionate reductase
MARNLLRAGFQLVVHNRSQGAVEELVSAGAQRATSPGEVAASAETVITMLPDTPDVEAVLLGPQGVVSRLCQGALVMDMSTIDPLATRRLAEQVQRSGGEMLDAPVSGGERGAVEGTLSIMVGGSEAAFERAQPLFQAMGKTIVHIGSSGAGQVAKACNQLVVAANLEAVAEALVLAAKAGVDPARVREVLLGGFAQSRVLETHGQRMLERKFEPGFKARLHRKDAGIVMHLAGEVGVPLPLFERAAQALDRLVDNGGGELDHSALVTVVEEQAGVRLGG